MNFLEAESASHKCFRVLSTPSYADTSLLTDCRL